MSKNELTQVPPPSSQIEKWYYKGGHLCRREMRSALNSTMVGANIVSFDLSFTAKDDGFKKKILRIATFAKLRFHLKLFFNKGYERDFKASVGKIVKSYKEFYEKAVSTSGSGGSEETKKEDKTEELKKQFEETKEKHGAVQNRYAEAQVKLDEQNSLLGSRQNRLKILLIELQQFPTDGQSFEEVLKLWNDDKKAIEAIIDEIKAYKAAPEVNGWFWGKTKNFDDTNLKKALVEAGISEPFDFKNYIAEEAKYVGMVANLDESVEKFKEKTAEKGTLEAEIDTLTTEIFQVQTALRTLSAEEALLRKEMKELQAKIEAKPLETIEPPPEKKNELESPQTDEVDSLKKKAELNQEPFNPVKIHEGVEKKINTSIDSDPNPKEHEVTKYRQKRFLEKPCKSAALEMSGVDEKTTKLKLGIVVSTLSKALEDRYHNERLCKMLSDLVLAIISYDPKVNDQQKKQVSSLIEFVFGLDADTQIPQLNEGMRLRLLASIIGSVSSLTHYFHEPSLLRGIMEKVKKFEGTFIAARARKIGDAIVKHSIKNTMAQMNTIDGHERYAEHRNIIQDTFSKIMIDVMLGKEQIKVKKDMNRALEYFGKVGFKEFMDQISLEQEPNEEEVVTNIIKLFDTFVKELSNV